MIQYSFAVYGIKLQVNYGDVDHLSQFFKENRMCNSTLSWNSHILGLAIIYKNLKKKKTQVCII